jgi:heme oxygenase (biliverdin-producing, ferredoxin)
MYAFSALICAVTVFAVVGFRAPLGRTGNSYLKRSFTPSMTAGMAEENAAATEYSFVNKELRAYAMKLHTPQQAPKEGKAKSPEAFESEKKAAEAMKVAQAAAPEVPMIIWQPARINYVQFLVDSLQVFETIESLTEEYPILAPLKSTGLERSAALKEDLDWIVKTYPSTVIPPPGPHGPGYAAHLRELAATSMPKFICHYYNHMFAHTAGGRMIGKSMADKLLDGTTLNFYKWDGDVKVNRLAVRT